MAWDGLTNPYDKQAMGVVRRAVRRTSTASPARSRTSSRPSRCAARRPRWPTAPSRTRSRRSRSRGRKGDVVIDTDEQPGKCDIAQDPDAAARLQEGRHHHRRQLLEHQRRRRGAGADVRGRGRSAAASSRWRASSRTPPIRRRRSGSPPRRSRRSARCWTRPAGKSATSTCSRSTRPSRRVAMAPMRELGIDRATS